MYIDVIQQFAKRIRDSIQTIRIYDQYFGVQFGIEKCVMLKNKSGKRQITELIELSNQERIRTLRGKEKLQVPGNNRSGHHQTSRYESKIKIE